MTGECEYPTGRNVTAERRVDNAEKQLTEAKPFIIIT